MTLTHFAVHCARAPQSGGALATPAHTSASVEPSSVSSVDSEAAVIANAQARANPADRALRAEVRTAQRLFAPGGDGAVAAATSYAVAQVRHCACSHLSLTDALVLDLDRRRRSLASEARLTAALRTTRALAWTHRTRCSHCSRRHRNSITVRPRAASPY